VDYRPGGRFLLSRRSCMPQALFYASPGDKLSSFRVYVQESPSLPKVSFFFRGALSGKSTFPEKIESPYFNLLVRFSFSVSFLLKEDEGGKGLCPFLVVH